MRDALSNTCVDEVIITTQKVFEDYHCSFSITPGILDLKVRAKELVLRNYDRESYEQQLQIALKALEDIREYSSFSVDTDWKTALKLIDVIAKKAIEETGDA